MPFGLFNAPLAFQRLMNEIFADLLDVYVVIYLDDILIYSDNLGAHKQHVEEVLQRLQSYRLYVSPLKCIFHKERMEFLEYILSPEGLQMDKKKVHTIKEWPVPRQVKDVQAFFGFANFYRRFIYNYSELSVPLTWLTKKNLTWSWMTEYQNTFDALKRVFITAPVLAHWDPEAPIMVETDALDHALATILSIHVRGDIHPVAFHSKMFNPSELNYDVHDKELLVIYEAFRKWCHYLEGTPRPVDVVTDHRNLIYFSGSKLLTRR